MRYVCFLVIFSNLVLAQSDKPATKPGGKWVSLAKGEIRYTEPPENWSAVPLPDGDGNSAVYNHADGHAVITMSTTEQPSPLPDTPAVRHSFGTQIVKAMRADLEKNGVEILDGPKLERDPRFFIRIRDRIRHNGVTQDRLHLYRGMRYQLARLTVNVNDKDADEVKQCFAVGEAILDGAINGQRERKAPTTRPVKR